MRKMTEEEKMKVIEDNLDQTGEKRRYKVPSEGWDGQEEEEEKQEEEKEYSQDEREADEYRCQIVDDEGNTHFAHILDP